MPSIPAFCDHCGTPFSSGYFFDNSFNITLSGCKSGPCPNCGCMGHVPDGIFNFIDNTIEILSAPQRTIEELKCLTQILLKAKSTQQSIEQVAEQIKIEVPSFFSLVDILPKNKEELYGFLAVVLAAIQLLTQSPQPAQNITINVSQVVEQTLAITPAAKKSREVPAQSTKIARNKPCPCGSGKKHKKCCGFFK